MTVSPFDHSFLSGLLGDAELAALFTAEADIGQMLAFETALAAAQAAEGVIPAEAAAAISSACRGLRPDMAALAAGTARDGVVVPALVAQLRQAIGAPHAAHLHHGATSQDLIDSSLAVRLSRAAAIIDGRIRGVIETLGGIDGNRLLMGRTRMQRARPIALAHKIAAWRDPLLRHRERLTEIRPRAFLLQFGGAVGDRAELGDKGQAVADRLADALGLARSPRARHAERDGFVEFGQWLALVTGSLGKLGQDILLMAQNEVGEIRLEGGGGSSAMPHKSNPVAAEVLVTLARYNAALAGGLHQALVHENERSGSAWTLEWLILPQMTVAAGASLRQAASLLSTVTFL